MAEILGRLARILEERKQANPEFSYVAGLYGGGLDAILQKVGEEAIETVLAAKGGRAEEVIHETADLWFHTLIMLAHLELGPEDIIRELESRFGLSGLDEKAGRSGK